MASLVAQSVKNLPIKGTTFNAGDTGLIPGLGRSTGGKKQPNFAPKATRERKTNKT